MNWYLETIMTPAEEELHWHRVALFLDQYDPPVEPDVADLFDGQQPEEVTQ